MSLGANVPIINQTQARIWLIQRIAQNIASRRKTIREFSDNL